MTFQQFIKRVDDTFLEHQASRSGGKISAANQWRYGQTVMNVLYDVWPEKYINIRDTIYDCFYTNKHIDLTIEKLQREWHEKVS